MSTNALERGPGLARAKRRRTVALWLLLVLLTPGTASAYIDPGAGSFVVQALIALAAGIAVTGRLYWSKIKSLLGLGSAGAEDDEDDPSDDD